MLDEQQGRLPRARGAVPELAHRRAGDPRVGRPRARPTASTGTPSSTSSRDVRPQLSHLKIALLADWSYSIKDLPLREFLERVQGAGRRRAAGPRPAAAAARRSIYETAARRRPADRHDVLLELGAAGHRGGGRARLGLHLPRLRVRAERDGRAARSQRARAGPASRCARSTDVPIAVGFGVKTRERHRGARRGRRRRGDRRQRLRRLRRGRAGRRTRRGRGLPRLCWSSWGRLP